MNNGPFIVVLYHETLAPNLLCFLLNDLRPIAENLQAAAVPFEQPLTTTATGISSLLLRDPDGQWIYLLSYPLFSEARS